MTEIHRSNGRLIITEPLSKTRRVTATAERPLTGRTSDRTPRLNRPIHLNWEMLVIWSFVVISFAAFFFCFWAIPAKCRGDWPS